MTEENVDVVNPFEVKTTSPTGIDYTRLIQSFGSEAITPELLEKFERITGQKPHKWLRRGLFFSHRNLNELLDKYASGEPIYLYTGRGPSGEMHLGHAVPFIFTKWLQDVFNAILVIQMSDDEKFLFKENLTLEEACRLGRENAKDIIAFGFNPEKTFIFSNFEYNELANRRNILEMMKRINMNQTNHVYGFDDTANIGMVQWPICQMTPAFSNSFPHLFGTRKDICCLVPCAIDQDPYFRHCRDVAPKMGCLKPYLIHGKFLVALEGIQSKMSTTHGAPKSIMLDDTMEMIAEKIKKYAFSGGRDTLKEHREFGADLAVDVAYQYLLYFEESDEKLAEIASAYGSGQMLTSEIKKYLIEVVCRFASEHQERKKAITPELLDYFYAKKPMPLR